MDDQEKEYYLQWIIADYTPFEFDAKSYFITTPSRENRFLAERFYMSIYDDAIKNGLYDKSGINKLLNKNNLWSDDKENTLNKLINDLEDIKLWIYENYNNTSKRNQFKLALKDSQDYIEKLLKEKQSFDMYDARYVAMLAKQHYLMGSSIFRRKNKPLFRNWWASQDDDIVQYTYKVMSDYSLSDKEYRELARSSSWRNTWSARKSVGNLLGKSSVDLSPQQKQIITWSNVYDSVFKHSDCPSDVIIEDDDALDGWMIFQRRKRDKETNKQIVEKALTNSRIRNSEQIYIMCDPAVGSNVIVDDPSKVYDCNDIEGKIRFKRIMSQIQKENVVSYMGLRDTQMEIYRKANEG